MKKFLNGLLTALGTLAALLLFIWIGAFAAKHILYRDYLKEKQDVTKIPALNDGFTPQGITYLEDRDIYLHSGYNGKSIALYLTEGKAVRELIPLDETGAVAKGHGGGITDFGEYAYIADDSSLLVYRLSDILAAENGAEIACVRRIPVDNKASFCFAADGWMYVGEFYRAGSYETDDSHIFKTPAGEEHQAIVSRYEICPDGTLAERPACWIAVPSQVQGFAVTSDGRVALSRSWGLNSSYLEFYTMQQATAQTPYGAMVPLYYVGSDTMIEQLRLPAFSEDLDIHNDRVIVTYESACNKYIIGKLFFAFEAASYPIPKQS